MSNTKRVPGVGPSDARIAIVGEAPGKNEVAQGKPFVGRAGRELNRLLSEVGINRSDIYITNVVKRKLKNNSVKEILSWTSQGANTDEEYDLWEQKLKQELTELGANVVVPMGKTALYALTREKKITKWRGSVIESNLVPGQKVIPAIHPAATFYGSRAYVQRYFIKFDLMRAKEEASTPELPERDNTYILEPSFDECIEYLEACKDTEAHGFDIEVNNKGVTCISFSHTPDSAISIPFVSKGRHGYEEYFLPDQEKAIWSKIAEVLEDPSLQSIAHNATFDVRFLFNRWGINTKNVHDTMVANRVLWPDFPRGLDFVTSVYTKLPYYKDDGKHAKGTGRRYWLYNAKDSIVLSKAFPEQRENLHQMNRWDTYNHQRKLILPCVFMTENGIECDVEGLRTWADELSKEYEEIKDKIEEIGGIRFNPNSPKQCKQYFYELRGEKPYKKSGRPTTNEKAMKQLSRKGYKEASLVLKARGKRKLQGTYAEMDLDPDGRMRGAFDVVGTKFGRFSSRKTFKGTGGNMQNLPYSFRAYLEPDEGYVGYEIDGGQAENRVVAYLGPDFNMMEAFEEGQDIHSKTAALVFGWEYEEALERHQLYEKAKEADRPDLVKKAAVDVGNGKRSPRYWGKRLNHALNYGMGPRTFSRNLEIPISEAKLLRNRYLEAYPGVKKFWNMVENELRENRTLTNLFGRKYTFIHRWNDTNLKDAYAFIPQSTVADLINRGGVREVYENQGTYEEAELLSQVHDSIWLQLPLDIGWPEHERMLREICKSMERTLQWRGRELSIPAEVTQYRHNFRDGHEIGEVTHLTAGEFISALEDTYRDLK